MVHKYYDSRTRKYYHKYIEKCILDISIIGLKFSNYIYFHIAIKLLNVWEFLDKYKTTMIII